MLDCQLISLLPWKYSAFAESAKGFPDMRSMQVTSYYKIAQDMSRFTCNIIYLVTAQDEAAAPSVEAMTYFNILASIVSIVLASMVAVMKSSVLKEVEARKGTAADDDKYRSTSKSNENNCSDDDVEMSGGRGDDESIQYTHNPLARREGGDILRLSALHTPVRSFLMKVLPDISNPSLHAIDTAMKVEGVETVEELTKYVDSGVIGVTELKAYAKKGKLGNSETLALIKAIISPSPSSPSQQPVNVSSPGVAPSSVSVDGGMSEGNSTLRNDHQEQKTALEDLTAALKSATDAQQRNQQELLRNQQELLNALRASRDAL